MYLSIIIPAYNEERRLGHTLESISAFLFSKPWESEVLVVSDGSRDGTVSVAQGFVSRIKNLRIIANSENHGKGAVVRQGMLEARGDLRLFMDADNATPITELEKFLPYINQGYDVVIGSLGLPESQYDKRKFFLRMLAGRAGNWFIQFILLWGIYDTQRGFKLFTRRAAEAIFPKVIVTGWGFDVEALVLARRAGFKIKELPVLWMDVEGSKIGFRAYPEVLWQVIKIRWRMWFGE
jgi:dolichyl-phosphate beta-glucosyltransferase